MSPTVVKIDNNTLQEEIVTSTTQTKLITRDDLVAQRAQLQQSIDSMNSGITQLQHDIGTIQPQVDAIDAYIAILDSNT